ncbi:hypothetical protein [Adhaeribacter terreus]|uniref:Uncharacterized protein n=1 Tax=Adhaeribacter terreus TaxID=529703 RepID=A0ABW0E966_9BACT
MNTFLGDWQTYQVAVPSIIKRLVNFLVTETAEKPGKAKTVAGSLFFLQRFSWKCFI